MKLIHRCRSCCSWWWWWGHQEAINLCSVDCQIPLRAIILAKSLFKSKFNDLSLIRLNWVVANNFINRRGNVEHLVIKVESALVFGKDVLRK